MYANVRLDPRPTEQVNNMSLIEKVKKCAAIGIVSASVSCGSGTETSSPPVLNHQGEKNYSFLLPDDCARVLDVNRSYSHAPPLTLTYEDTKGNIVIKSYRSRDLSIEWESLACYETVTFAPIT